MASLTPDFRKVGMSIAPSPSPFLTPRPERRRTESRGLDWNANRPEKDKEINIQVLLRCRPLSDDEQRLNVPKVISCNENRREVTVMQSIASKQVDRVFTFDRVFGPKAQQRSIYDQAISPIVNEVLEGFNCTVFAYGQTGTGKTYTMEGGMRNKSGELPAEAGIIPRAVRQIFDTLEAQNADYSMKVTFSELYNEEITDLLAPEDHLKLTEDRPKKPICLMEDGKGSVIVRGLEEEVVYSANDIYSLLERGAARRRTADTLLNKRSSRSHSIFTICVHIKEGVVGDEELIKCGKLNLVDLAGSENIYRSGAREARAREAGEINKSLLTLGRVINALVEHSVHIPYRDSKLTRLLRDSLGGKTKTCIIATISPLANCLDETLSTLDYAYRAKSIKNKPEANQKVTKAMLLKDIYMEMERMKQDIRAAREKNGVYIPQERFLQDEAEKKAQSERIEQLESELSVNEKQLDRYRELYVTEQEEKLHVESELKHCKENLQTTRKSLEELQDDYKTALSLLKEKESTISKLQDSENNLVDCAKKLRVDLHDASEDLSALFGKIDRKDRVEKENQNILHSFGAQLDHSLKDLNKIIHGSLSEQEQQLRCVEDCVTKYLSAKYESNEAMEAKVNKLSETYASGASNMKQLIDALQKKTSSDLEQTTSMASDQLTSVENFLKDASIDAKEIISDIQNSLDEQRQLLAFSAKQQAEGLRRSLASAKAISHAAIDFSNDLRTRAFKLIQLLEQNQIEKSNRFHTFEEKFKNEALKEEKLAMDKIAVILSTLTSMKTDMVSKASKSLEDSCIQESQSVMLELSNIREVLASETMELNDYMEKAKDRYVEDTFSSTECRAALENTLQECAGKVELSGRKWQDAQSGVSRITNNGLNDFESAARSKTLETRSMHDNLRSMCSSMGEEFDFRVNELSGLIKDTFKLDKANKKEICSITTESVDQLDSIKSIHNERVSDIRSRSEQCIHKDYLVEQRTNTTPKKRSIAIPSLQSIEEMRTTIIRSKLCDTENKIHDRKRNPFQLVNGSVAL
ncbi:kinesin-like protein KIN-5B [Andrographis paniculata]|uniref:kinesin-like protein KIN-5B n=1 Tax=Andrographis paniculata TaxID=175694 RepID=UPI0021E986EE|nr:kinesin-like protein KIN-5B [Andrographis paniculata]